MASDCDGASTSYFPTVAWLDQHHEISSRSGLAACFVFGIATKAFYVSSYEYIIDSYAEHGAVALASMTTVRYVVAGGMVIAARPMYVDRNSFDDDNIGLHRSNTDPSAVDVPLLRQTVERKKSVCARRQRLTSILYFPMLKDC